MYILALEMASPGDQNCANCIGTLSLPTPAHRGDVDRKQFSDIAITQTDGANTQFRVWCRDCERHTHGMALLELTVIYAAPYKPLWGRCNFLAQPAGLIKCCCFFICNDSVRPII